MNINWKKMLVRAGIFTLRKLCERESDGAIGSDSEDWRLTNYAKFYDVYIFKRITLRCWTNE